MADTTTFAGATSNPVDAQGTVAAVTTVTGGAGRVCFATGIAVSTATASLINAASATFQTAPSVRTAGTPLPVEQRLLRSFPYPALEEARRRTLSVISPSIDPFTQTFAVLATACHTELRAALLPLLPGLEIRLKATLNRTRLLTLDAELQILSLKHPQMFRELRALRMPDAYQNLLEHYLTSTAHTHRASALCALLVLVAAILLDDEAHA